jgi:hypothetical protein
MFTGIFVVITFASDKRFVLVAIGPRLKGNIISSRKG